MTQPAGQAHAEVVALRAAGDRAAGADLYVTLEPCSHWGRTPPCTDALIAAGIAAAHVAVIDPHPLVSGCGVEQLRAVGIEVQLGDGQAEAEEILEAWMVYARERRAFVTVADGVPPDELACLRADADLTVVAQAPIEWIGDEGKPVYLDEGGTPVRLRRIAGREVPGQSLLPDVIEADTFIDVPAALGAMATPSLLIAGDPPIARRLLAAQAVDTIVAPKDRPPPAGFAPSRSSGDGSGADPVLYRHIVK
jgi:hypothetical protein